MIKSKGLSKISGPPAEEGELNKKRLVKGLRKKDEFIKPKLYPIPEEDSFMPIDEDSEEIKYQTKKNVF
jgi:hypothetical protein